jgi:hypothetical protein
MCIDSSLVAAVILAEFVPVAKAVLEESAHRQHDRSGTAVEHHRSDYEVTPSQ